MTTTNALTDLIRALARRDWTTADRLVTDLDQARWQGGLQVIGVAFAIAVNRSFGTGRTAADISRFVADARARAQDNADLPALEMEGLIRAALGEPELADNISPEVALSVEVFVLGQLLQDENLTDAQLNEFIAEVEQTAADYL